MDGYEMNPLCENTIPTAVLQNEVCSCTLFNTCNRVEVDLVIGGTGIHRIQDRLSPCKEGDVCILSPHIVHEYEAEDVQCPLTIRRFTFDPTFYLQGEVGTQDSPRFCHGVFCEGTTAAYATLNKKTRERVEILFQQIETEIRKKSFDWESAVGSYLSLLLITLSRYMNDAIRNLTPGSQREREIISSVLRTVKERFSEDSLTLESISSNLYVSSSLLSRLFKRCVGKSFSDYLREMRMAHACRLLKETDMTVDQILLSCGLRDLPSFYRSFHLYVHMTPTQYRNQHTNTHVIGTKGEKNMIILSEISENLQKGKSKIVKELVQKALDEGIDPTAILNEGLLSGMSIVGERFKNNEIFIPEVLIAARAMNMGTALLKPRLAQEGVPTVGKVCIGTVQGDLHDIGKNLVRMMLEGKGFEVIDLGTDVAPETFVKTAIEQDCKIICCSALLTTTMTAIADVVKAAEEAGIRDQVKIMAGGAPVTQQFCDQIGVDVYTVDAASAANAAYELCKQL